MSSCNGVAGIFFVGRSLEHFDRRPISVQLVCEHHRKRRVHALSHICVRDDGGDRVVRGDLHPDIQQGLVFAGDQTSYFRSTISRAQGNADRERSARYNGGRNECAPGPLAHSTTPRTRVFRKAWQLRVLFPCVYAGRFRSDRCCRSLRDLCRRPSVPGCLRVVQRRT